jgi:hypothetical protein
VPDPDPGAARLPVPRARGPVSAAVLERLTSGAPDDGPGMPSLRLPLDVDLCFGDLALDRDLIRDDDVQLALHVLYELHYRGVRGVDDRWEWDPELLRLRALLERAWEEQLRAAVPADPAGMSAAEVVDRLDALTAPSPKPGLSSWIARRGELEHFRELLVRRSVYHLKEADPHTLAIPRLHGAPKAALVEIQADEYGGGRPEWVHSTLYAQAMRALGLDDSYGHYVDDIPASSLAVINLMSFFGLHRRLRAASVGHLTLFEMTSTRPNRFYAQGLRRLGAPPEAVLYFDEHVEADAVHEQIASRHLAGGLVAQDPSLSADLLFGTRAAIHVDDVVGEEILDAWQAGRSALRVPAEAVA